MGSSINAATEADVNAAVATVNGAEGCTNVMVTALGTCWSASWSTAVASRKALRFGSGR